MRPQRQSKKAKYIQDVAEALHKFSVVAHKYNYVFVGAFANISFNYFRSAHVFNILVSADDYALLCADLLVDGFLVAKNNNNLEICTDVIIIQVELSSDRHIFTQAQPLNVNAFNKEYNLKMVAYTDHVAHLKSADDPLAAEDIIRLETNSMDSHSSASQKMELYVYYMSLGDIKHDHSEGSDNCKICRRMQI